MKNLFRKILASPFAEENVKPEEMNGASIEEVDSRHTSDSGIPHYDLRRLASNIQEYKVREDRQSPEKSGPEIRSMRPSLVKRPLEDDSHLMRVAERFDKAEKDFNQSTPLPETVNERYDIIEPVGEGGTAIVYRAMDRTIGREIAFKRFHEGIEIHGGSGEFNKEIETVTRVDHPNVVVTHDVGKDADGVFIVMNLIRGNDLEKVLESGPLEISEFKEFGIQALEGLMAVHAEQVLHLDLKPSNIMVSSHGSGRKHVQLIDFGSAKVMSSDGRTRKEKKNDLKGSIYFMSPEQINNDELDVRTDIYSMGCVFYQALAGTPPFQGETPIQVMAAHLQNKFVPLHEQVVGISGELSDLVSRMISNKPGERPADVNEVLAEFLQLKLS